MTPTPSRTTCSSRRHDEHHSGAVGRRRGRRRLLGPEPGPQLPLRRPTGTWWRSATSTWRRAQQVVGDAAGCDVTDDLGRAAGAATTSTRSPSRRRRARTAASPRQRCGPASTCWSRSRWPTRVDAAAGDGRRWPRERGLVLMADHTYCYTPAVQKIRELIADGRARRHPVRRLGADQPRSGPARRRRLLGPRAARPVDPRLHPARRAATRSAVAAHGADPLGAGKACVGYLTLPLAGGAIAHVHVNWLSPTKIRQMVIGGSRADPGLGRPQPAAAAQRLRPRRRPRSSSPVDSGRPRARPTVSYRLGDIVGPGAARARGARRDGRRVRRQHPRGPRAAHRRRGRAAGALGARGRRAPACAHGGALVDRRRSPSRDGARPMTHARRAHASWSPAAPARSARPSSTSCSTPGVGARRRARQPGPRPPREPRRRARRPAGSTLVEGDIRDRDLVHDLTARQGPGLPPGRDPDHPVRRGAAAGARGAGRRHLQRPRGRRRARGRQGRRRVVGLGLRPGRGVPDRPSATTTTTTTRSTARRSRSTRACCAASAPCTAWTTSLLRYFNVYGPRMDVHGLYTEVLVRWMERIADGQPPLIFGDGLQTMDFVYTTRHRPGQPAGRGQRRHRGRLQHRQRHRDQPARAGRGAAARRWTPTCRVEHGPERAVNGVARRLADTSAAQRDLGFTAEVGLEDGPARAGRVVAPAARGDRRRPARRCAS